MFSTHLECFAAVSLLLGSVQAHMFISSPSPIAGTFPKDPLDPSGSNWPCHGVSLPSSGGQSMAAGSDQLLAFELGAGANTAVHGGGSCQIAITYETEAARQKDPNNWKVIYSILGGCPSDTAGNLDSAIACTSDKQANCVNEFHFKIPAGVKNGHAILAWTWFNNVGNREMYMNCVNAEFSGGDGSEVDGLPAIFVANLASVDKCPTTESINVDFPHPGRYVTTKTESDPYPLAIPTGDGCYRGSVPSEYHHHTSAQTAAHHHPTTTTTTTTTTPDPAPTAVSSHTATTQTPSATSAATPDTSFILPAAATCAQGTIPCPKPGHIICVDSAHFGICDIDSCALPVRVAPGTVCSKGVISRRVKRGLRDYSHLHAHHHHHHRH